MAKGGIWSTGEKLIFPYANFPYLEIFRIFRLVQAETRVPNYLPQNTNSFSTTIAATVQLGQGGTKGPQATKPVLFVKAIPWIPLISSSETHLCLEKFNTQFVLTQ